MLDMKVDTFIQVVKEKSYTKAAQVLHLTQPAVTQHIHKLEKYYGCKLFKKSGKSFELTQEGRFLYHYCLLQKLNAQAVKDQIKRETKRLKLGATLSIADYYLPKYLVTSIRDQEVPYEILVRNTRDLTDLLLRGEIDCAFIEGDFDHKLFQAHAFETTAFIGVVRNDHPLQSPVTMDQVFAYPLILREEGSGTRKILEDYLSQKGQSVAQFEKIDQVSSFIMIKSFLEHTHGISFMYEGVCAREIEAGSLRPLIIEDYEVTRTLHFIYPRNSVNEEIFLRFFKSLGQEPRR